MTEAEARGANDLDNAAALASAREQQAATREVLETMSASGFDLKKVLQTIAESAVRLCRADNASVIRRDATTAYEIFASAGHFEIGLEEYERYFAGRTFQPGKGSLTGRVLLARKTVQIEDMSTDPDYDPASAPTMIPQTLLGVPIMQGGEVEGIIIVRRYRVATFNAREIEILETFSRQAAIAIDNVRLFNETKESLGQQTALSDVLRTISRSAFDLDAVLQTIVERAAALVGAETASISRRDGDEAVVLAQVGSTLPASVVLGTRIPVSERTLIGRALLTGKRQYVADAIEHPDLPQDGPRTRLLIPFLRDGRAIGTLGVSHNLPKPFSDRELQMLETFADQAAIAIENVRLFNETREGLERQTALGEVLRATAAFPGNIQPVLDAVAANAARLLDADDVLIARLDGAHVVAAAHVGEVPVLGAGVRDALDPGMVSHRAILEARAIHVPDLLATGDFPKATELARQTGQRTSLAVPLVREGTPIGAILIRRTEVRPFTEPQVQLLQAFADQAAIAIENVRLFNETKESLERQTALAEILRVIASSPSDQQPVFDAIAANATRYCGAKDAVVLLVQSDALVPVSHHGPIPTPAMTPTPIVRTGVAGRAILERRTVHVADLTGPAGDEFPLARLRSAESAGHRGILATPLLREGTAIGTILLRKLEPSGFTPSEIQLVEAFADQAVIAIENVRLFNETKEALERQTAISEILRAIANSPGNEKPVLATIAHSATMFCGAADASILLIRDGQFRFAAHHGPVLLGSDSFSIPMTKESVAGHAVVDRRTIQVADVLGQEGEAYPPARDGFPKTGQRAILATPLVREGTAIGAIVLRKTEPGEFSSNQVTLVEAFADQAVIAIENVRLFNETREALERQTATSEVLKTISRAPFELQPILDTLVQNAARLTLADNADLVSFVDGGLRDVAQFGDASAEYRRILDERMDGTAYVPRRGTVVGRTLIEGRPVHIVDVLDDKEYVWHEAQAAGGFRTVLGVPLVREDRAIGVIVVWRREVKPFTARQIELLTTFADQAVIAMENVRLFNETKEALERQTATSSILNVISRSPADQQPTLDAIVESGARLCDAEMAFAYVVEQGFFRLRAGYKVPPAFVDYTNANPVPVTAHRGSLSGRVVAERRAVQIPDVLADAEYTYLEGQRLVGYRAMLNVPMFSKGELIGLIGLWRTAPIPFTTKQIELMSTFADQAVIAIENTRLFNETREALERQTATSEVLKTISRAPFELQPILDTLVQNAARLSLADNAHLVSFTGGVLRDVARVGETSEEYERIVADRMNGRAFVSRRGTVDGRVILERRPVHIVDVLEDAEYEWHEAQRAGGFRSVLGVPLMRQDQPIGVIVVSRRRVDAFTDKQIELLTTFADQAVIAMENVRLFNETKESLEQQHAVAEVLKTVSQSVFDLQPVLNTVVENAARLADGDVAWLARTVGPDAYRIVARFGSAFDAPDIASAWGTLETQRTAASGSVMGRLLRERKVLHIDDISAEPELWRASQLIRATKSRTVLAVPMLREGQAIGGVIVCRQSVRPFSGREIQLVQTFADQAAIAIENVRLFDETKEALEQQTAVAEVLKTISRSAFDLQPVLDIVLDNAVRLAGADIGWLSRVEDEQFMTVAYSSEFPQQVRDALGRQRAQGHLSGPWVPLGEKGGVMGFTLAEGRTVHLADVRADERLKDSIVARLTESRTVIGVPMRREGQSIGGMVLARYQVRPFSEREIELVQTFTDQAAIAIGNVRLFNEIQDKSRQLEVASRHKSEFLANMSHELRTPLNAIIGFSEVLIQGLFGDVNEKQREYLQDVVGSGQHLLALINDILDLSKIEAGRMELEPSTFSFRGALESGVTIVRERAGRHSITLSVVVSNDLGEIEADERKVKQIFYNLLTNAVKFTADGGSVEVTARRENGDVRVEVRDNGIGIAEVDQVRIFEEFQQVGRERSREGTGLGLTLTKRFVELHGGRIWLESAPGKGSTFAFTLPLRQTAPVRA